MAYFGGCERGISIKGGNGKVAWRKEEEYKKVESSTYYIGGSKRRIDVRYLGHEAMMIH